MEVYRLKDYDKKNKVRNPNMSARFPDEIEGICKKNDSIKSDRMRD